MKRPQIPQKLAYEKFYVQEKFYEHKIAAVNLSKHNRDLNRDLNTIQFW